MDIEQVHISYNQAYDVYSYDVDNYYTQYRLLLTGKNSTVYYY